MHSWQYFRFYLKWQPYQVCMYISTQESSITIPLGQKKKWGVASSLKSTLKHSEVHSMLGFDQLYMQAFLKKVISWEKSP